MEGASNQYLTITEAASLCPGRTPSHWTVRRWITDGIRGVQLRAIYNGRWYTTPLWLRQFLEARAASRLGRRHRAVAVEETDAALVALREEWGWDV